MRTRAKGRYCLSAIALGANVRVLAHTFSVVRYRVASSTVTFPPQIIPRPALSSLETE